MTFTESFVDKYKGPEGAVKETIQTILNAENAAREQVEKARGKAKEIRLKAEQEAEALISQTREKCLSDVRILLGNAEKAGEDKKNKLLRDRPSSQKTQPAGKEKQNEKIVNQLLQLIIGKEALPE